MRAAATKIQERERGETEKRTKHRQETGSLQAGDKRKRDTGKPTHKEDQATKRAREARVAELDEYTKHEEERKGHSQGSAAKRTMQKELKNNTVHDQSQQEQQAPMEKDLGARYVAYQAMEMQNPLEDILESRDRQQRMDARQVQRRADG